MMTVVCQLAMNMTVESGGSDWESWLCTVLAVWPGIIFPLNSAFSLAKGGTNV